MEKCSCNFQTTLRIVHVGETSLWVIFSGNAAQRARVAIRPLVDEGASSNEFLLTLGVSPLPILVTALLRPNCEYSVEVCRILDDDDVSICVEHAAVLLVHTSAAVELHRLRQVTERSCSLSWVRPSQSSPSAIMQRAQMSATSTCQIWARGEEQLSEVELSIYEHETVKGKYGGVVASASRRRLIKTLRVESDPNFVTVDDLMPMTAYSVKVRGVSRNSFTPGDFLFGLHPSLTPFFVTLPPQECSVSPAGPTSLVVRRFREYSAEFTEQLTNPSLCMMELHPPSNRRTDDVPERLVIVARWQENEHMRARAVEDVETIADFVDVNRAQKSVEKLRKKSTTFGVEDRQTETDPETALALRRRRSEVNAIMVFQEKRKELIRRKLAEELYRNTSLLPLGWTESVVDSLLPGVRYVVQLQHFYADGWVTDNTFAVALPSTAVSPILASDDVVAPLGNDIVMTGPMSLGNLRAFLALRFSEFVTVEHVSETTCTISWSAVNFEQIAKLINGATEEQAARQLTYARCVVQAAEEMAERHITLDYCLVLKEGPATGQSRLALADDVPATRKIDVSDASMDLSSERSGRLLAAVFLRGSAPAPSSLRPRCPSGWTIELFSTFKNDRTLSNLQPGTEYTLQLAMYNAIDRAWSDLSEAVTFTTLQIPQPLLRLVAHTDGATSASLAVEIDRGALIEQKLPPPHFRHRHAFSVLRNSHVDITFQRAKTGPVFTTLSVKRVSMQALVNNESAVFRNLETNAAYRILARTAVDDWKRGPQQPPSQILTQRPLYMTLVCIPVSLSEVDGQRNVTLSATIPEGVLSSNALWTHMYGIVALSNAHVRKTIPFTPGSGGIVVSTQGYDRLSAQAVVTQTFSSADFAAAERTLGFGWLQEAANLSFAVDWAPLPCTIMPNSFEFLLSSTVLAVDIDLASGQGVKECMTLLSRHAARKESASSKGNLQGLVVVVEVREEWPGGEAKLLKYHCGFDDLVVEDLLPGSKYAIRVRPVLEENIVSGDVYGLWSKRLVFVTPNLLHLAVTGADETSVAVRWIRDDFQPSPSMMELRTHGSTDPQRSTFGISSSKDLYSYLYRHCLFGRYRLVWSEVIVVPPQSMETASVLDYVIKDLKPSTLLLVKVQQRRFQLPGESLLDRSVASRTSSAPLTSSLLGSNREQSNMSFKRDTTWCAATICVRTLAELCPVVHPLGFNEYQLQLVRQAYDDSEMDNSIDDEMIPVHLHVATPAPVVQAQIRILPALSGAGEAAAGRIGPIQLPADLEDPWPHPNDAFVDGDAYWRDSAPTRPWFTSSNAGTAVPLHDGLIDVSIVKPCIAPGGLGEYVLANLRPGRLEFAVVGVRPGVSSYVQLRYRTQDQPRPSSWSIHAGIAAHFPPSVSVEHAGDSSIALLLGSPPLPKFHPSEGDRLPSELQVEVIGFAQCDAWDPTNEEFEMIDNHGRMFRIDRQIRRIEPPVSGSVSVLFDGLRTGSCYVVTASSSYPSALQGPATVSLCVATIPPAKCTVLHASDVFALVQASREEPQYETDLKQIISFCNKSMKADPRQVLLARLRSISVGLRNLIVVPPILSDAAFDVKVLSLRGKDEVDCTSVQPHPNGSLGQYFLLNLQPGSIFRAFTRPSSVAVSADWSSPALFGTKLAISLRMERSSESSAIFSCVLAPPTAVPLWAEVEVRRVWARSTVENRLVCVRGDEDDQEHQDASRLTMAEAGVGRHITAVPLRFGEHGEASCRVCVSGLSLGCFYVIRSKPAIDEERGLIGTNWADAGCVATSPYVPSLPSLYEWNFPHVSLFWTYDKLACETTRDWAQRRFVGREMYETAPYLVNQADTVMNRGDDDDDYANDDARDVHQFVAATRIAKLLPNPAPESPPQAGGRLTMVGGTNMPTIIAGPTHRSAPYASTSVRFELEVLDRRGDASQTRFFSVGQVPRPFARAAWQPGDDRPVEEASNVFFRIRAVVAAPNIGDIKSAWTQPVSFLPLPRLMPPTGLRVEGQLGECVVFRWEAPAGIELHNQVIYDVEVARTASSAPSSPRRTSAPTPPPPGQHWRVAITVAEPRAVLQNLILREHYKVRVICRTTFSTSVSAVLGVTVFPRSEATRYEVMSARLPTTCPSQVNVVDAAKYPFPLPIARDARPPTAPSPFHVEFTVKHGEGGCVDLPIPLSLPNPPPAALKQRGPRQPMRPASANQSSLSARRRKSDVM